MSTPAALAGMVPGKAGLIGTGANPVPSPPNPDGQRGVPGNLNVYGFLTTEDYNPDLDGFGAYKTLDEMRRSDAQVAATVLQMKLPLKAASWSIEPGHDDTQGQAIADFVTQCLLADGAMEQTWNEVLDNALLKIEFGSACAEKIWGPDEDTASDAFAVGTLAGRQLAHRPEVIQLIRKGYRDGKSTLRLASEIGVSTADVVTATTTGPALVYKALAPRLPRTFYRWIEDPATQKLVSLQQFAPKGGIYGFWTIPVQDLVLFIQNREGNNWYGRSSLRGAYPHWFWKQQLYRIAAVSADREHAGIPRAAIQKDYVAKNAPLEEIVKTLKALRSHHLGFVTQPYGVEYDWLTSGGADQRMRGLLLLIEHHNVMIARNMLQQFSAQGEQRHGSFGSAVVTLSAFYDGLEGFANELAQEFNRQVIKPLVDAHFNMEGKTYPTLVCSDLGNMDLPQLSQSLQQLAAGQFITADDTMEDWLRDIMNAPPLPEELRGRDRNPAPPPVPVDPTTGLPMKVPTTPGQKKPTGPPPATKVKDGTSKGDRQVRASRMATPREIAILDLHGIPRRLDDEKARLVKSLTDLRLEHLKALAQKFAQKDSRKTAPFTDLRPSQLPAPKSLEYKRQIRAMQTRVAQFGAEEVVAELKRQGVPAKLMLAGGHAAATRRTMNSQLVSSAEVTSDRLASAWQSLALDNANRLRRAGLVGDALVDGIVNALRDSAESFLARAIGAEVNEAFGLGRAWQAEQVSHLIGEVEYSAVLDRNTCDNCAELDGESFEMDSEEYDDNLPPNPQCEGGDGCRCVYLYIAAEDSADESAA